MSDDIERSMLELALRHGDPDLIAAALRALSPQQAEFARYYWPLLARPKQIEPPGMWRVWLILAGRGFGKTRTGAETVRGWVESGRYSRIALIAPTAADCRDVIVEGESGIMAISPPWNMPRYEPSNRRITWPNGATATLYSAEEPDRLRGPQHSAAWCDEIAAWKYPETWDQLQFGLRLGSDPRVIVTTTPRPIPILKAMIADRERVVITTGNTFENAANLAGPALDALRAKYEGTRMGRQELYAEMLDDVPGALWTRDIIERCRPAYGIRPILQRVVVAIDPAGSAKKTADEAGIVTVGVAPCSCKGFEELHGFVLEDNSGRYQPRDMGQRAIDSFDRTKADRIVYESNFGGDMVADILRLLRSSIPTRSVHASKGKIVRAEPVAALYEQGKVHHLGAFPQLEDEMVTYTPQSDGPRPDSPGRMDALVWAITDLMIGETPASFGAADFKSPRVTFAPESVSDDDDDWGDDYVPPHRRG